MAKRGLSTDGIVEVLRKGFADYWKNFQTSSASGGKRLTQSLMWPTHSLQEAFAPSLQTKDPLNYWAGAGKPLSTMSAICPRGFGSVTKRGLQHCEEDSSGVGGKLSPTGTRPTSAAPRSTIRIPNS